MLLSRHPDRCHTVGRQKWRTSPNSDCTTKMGFQHPNLEKEAGKTCPNTAKSSRKNHGRRHPKCVLERMSLANRGKPDDMRRTYRVLSKNVRPFQLVNVGNVGKTMPCLPSPTENHHKIYRWYVYLPFPVMGGKFMALFYPHYEACAWGHSIGSSSMNSPSAPLSKCLESTGLRKPQAAATSPAPKRRL